MTETTLKFDLVSGDPLDDDGIPWPKRPGTKWDPTDSSLNYCKHCHGGYNDHGSSQTHLLCKAPAEEWERFHRARSLRHYEGRLAMFKGDLLKLNQEQRGDLLNRLRNEFCLKCGANSPEEACKCPDAER